MNIHRAYKTELKLNNKQRTACLKHAGTARFAYNWGLEYKEAIYRLNQLPVPHVKNPTAIDLHRELNVLKKTTYPWLYESSKCAPQEALRDLDVAFTNFFAHRAKYPQFKSRRKGIGSFTLTGIIKVYGAMIQLPTLGRLRLKEHGYIPTVGVHILSATVSEKAGNWYISIQVEEDLEVPINTGPPVGVDIGITVLATASDGMVYANPKALRTHERKLKRQQRTLARKQKGSNNRKKAVLKIQRTHQTIANIRIDAIHKATTELARTKSVIGIEDLNIRGMLKNHCLAKSISDAAFGEFRRQIGYKTQWYGSRLVVADRWFPSSKMCSRCGYIKGDMKLGDRTYICDECDLIIDRDLNSSLNLERLAVSSMESSKTPVGIGSAGLLTQVKLPMMNQESNIEPEVTGFYKF